MNYSEIKTLLTMCMNATEELGCQPIADDIEIALSTLEYAKEQEFID